MNPHQWEFPDGLVAVEAKCPECGSVECDLVAARRLPMGQAKCWDCKTIYAFQPDRPAKVIRRGRRR